MIPSKPLAQWRPGDPEQAYAFPSRYYYDAGVYTSGKWRRSSTPPGTSRVTVRKCASPGDFIKVDVLDQSVLVVCGEDGVARAFHNVCQHRGTRLVEERRGRIAHVIRCPYHAWAYRLDGRLRHAPRSEAVRGFDPGTVSLAPVRIEEISSFLFINLDPDAVSFREEVGGHPPRSWRAISPTCRTWSWWTSSTTRSRRTGRWSARTPSRVITSASRARCTRISRRSSASTTTDSRPTASGGPTWVRPSPDKGRPTAGRSATRSIRRTGSSTSASGPIPRSTPSPSPTSSAASTSSPSGRRRPCCASPTTARAAPRARSRRSACAGCPTTSVPRTSISTSASSGAFAPSAMTAAVSSSIPAAATTASISCTTSRAWSRKRCAHTSPRWKKSGRLRPGGPRANMSGMTATMARARAD